MPTDELSFLRDEVQRLNSVLSSYHEKYPPLRSEDGGTKADAPWTTDKSLMVPLFAEYDATIEELTQGSGPEAFASLRAELQRLSSQNQQLHRELKEVVENQLSGREQHGDDVGGNSIDAVENLQQQLNNVQQEKDAIEDMWRTSTMEIERLERALQNTRATPGIQQIEQQATQLKNQYMSSMNELEGVISGLQGQLEQKSRQLTTSQATVKELRSTLEECKMKMAQQEQSKSIVTGTKERSDSHVNELTRKLTDAQSKVDQMIHELEQTKRERNRVEQQLIDMQGKLAASDSKEYNAALQVRDSVQMVENAMLEKDQALQREKQALESLEKLESSMSKLMDEAGARTRKEVDNVKQQANKSIQKLMDDVHNLEMENTEKQTQLERAMREKRAVESELEKICQAGMLEGNKDGHNIDDLTRRACHAERARDDALLKLDHTEKDLRRLENSTKNDKNRMQKELDQVKERLDMMNNEFSSASDDKVSLLEQVGELKKRITSLQLERDTAVRSRTKEVACAEANHRLKEQELEAQIHGLEDSHRHAMHDIRQMLSQQQRLSAKWKEECQTISQKFESKLTELRDELSREKKRTSELTRLLKDSKEKTTEVEQMLMEYNHNIRRMEERVREAENRAATAHMQVGRQLRKDHANSERNIVEERRQMQRQLERSLAESKIGDGTTNGTANTLGSGTQENN